MAGLYTQFVKQFNPAITERSLDTVASLGSSDLDAPREDCQGSDNLVAGDMDDPVGAAAR